jgi:hypothetical protein
VFASMACAMILARAIGTAKCASPSPKLMLA